MIEGEDLELLERSIRQATERHTGEALDSALGEIGWADAFAIDPRTAVAVLFGPQGEANATSSALDHVLAASLGLDERAKAAVVLPPLGGWDAPARAAGGTLAVRGLGSSSLAGAETVLVAAEPEGGGTPSVVQVRASSLALRQVSGVDPALGLVEVSADAAAFESVDDPAGDWGSAVRLARLALGYELVGASRAMLRLAREHALDRIQFGQPIARFQAVRHRLAETLVAIESADGVLAAAWEDPLPELASSAKAVAGRGARTAARHCQQVLAGIGFTAEHPFHRYFRRILVLDQLFGSARALTEQLGRDLLESRRLPALMPL